MLKGAVKVKLFGTFEKRYYNTAYQRLVILKASI